MPLQLHCLWSLLSKDKNPKGTDKNYFSLRQNTYTYWYTPYKIGTVPQQADKALKIVNEVDMISKLHEFKYMYER